MCVPSHLRVGGNEYADLFAKETLNKKHQTKHMYKNIAE